MLTQQPRFLDPAFGHLACAFERRQKQPGKPPSVLVVDDEQMIREILTLGLSSYGFEVKTAAGGHEAVATCKMEAVDVALVDDQMPAMSGQETIAAIRRTAPWVRCCMMSGDIERCRSRNVRTSAIIGKPFALEDIARVLRRLAEQPLGCID
jgi:CheY-like chemotaxis protein